MSPTTINIEQPIPGYWTMSQCAVLAGVAPPTVRIWVREGKLTRHQIGGRQILIAAEELDRLIAERGRGRGQTAGA